MENDESAYDFHIGDMIKHIAICAIVYPVFCGCTTEKGAKSDLIEIDVRASYPEKEIQLEEIADIEYLQLETNVDYLFKEEPDIIASDIIIIRNVGDVFIFSREGKPLSKFNHKGNSREEYSYISQIIYDEKSAEIFVKTINKILVYTLSGDFKRLLPLIEGSSVNEFVNFDAQTLLLYDGDTDVYPSPLCLISKEDGRVVETIDIRRGKKLKLIGILEEKGFVTSYYISPGYLSGYKDGYLLADYSIDTVYFISPEKRLSPILVRKPKVQSMDPIIILNGFIAAGGYDFVCWVNLKPYSDGYLMRDRKTCLIYRQKITFNDYKGKQVYLSSETIKNTQDSKLGLINLDLEELKEANSENRITGKLKQMVENSEEDGNNIFMLLHFK